MEPDGRTAIAALKRELKKLNDVIEEIGQIYIREKPPGGSLERLKMIRIQNDKAKHHIELLWRHAHIVAASKIE